MNIIASVQLFSERQGKNERSSNLYFHQ